MKIHIYFIVLLGLSLSSCGQKESKIEVDASGDIWVGEKFDDTKVIGVPALLAKLSRQDSVAAVVRGQVHEVCQVKGCWMNVSGPEESQSLFVKFKDYGFFMPLDLSGEVLMNGYAYTEMTSVDELRHYAEDEGKSPDEIAAITEPEEELKFMASGVKILK